MKKTILLFLFFYCAQDAAAGIDAPINDNYARAEIKDGRTIIYPEVPTFVTMSNSDINRVVCPKSISDVRSSDEKMLLTPKIAGNEAFLKYTVVEGEKGLERAGIPTEIYIKCGNERYTLIALPKEIPAATIYLSGGLSGRIEANERMFKSISIEAKAVKIIISAYNDDLPESWIVKNRNLKLDVIEGINVVLKRKILVEGGGLDLYEYEISIAEGNVIEEVLLNEKDLAVRLDNSDNKLAAAIKGLILKRGDVSTFFLLKTVAGGNLDD